jgi:drug/metabolite transporter (DMT)-like permease
VSALALGLVLLSAAMHAGWNALVKRSGDGHAFIWCFLIASLLIYAAPVAVLLARHPPGRDGLPFIAASGTVHIAYYTLLSRAYRGADLSLAYPVARGTGVLLAPLLAVPIYGDRPTPPAWLGIATILAGILWLYAPVLRASVQRFGLGQILSGPPILTGLTIATYSLIDAGGARRVHPVIYLYLTMTIVVAALAPHMLRQRRAAVAAAQRHRRSVLLAGIASFATYVIVLTALRLAPVSYVIPIREVSIVFAAIIGARHLGEGLSRSRAAACALVTAGVLLIGIGG